MPWLGHSLSSTTLKSVTAFPSLLTLEVHARHIKPDQFDKIVGSEDYIFFPLASKVHFPRALFGHVQSNIAHWLEDILVPTSWTKTSFLAFVLSTNSSPRPERWRFSKALVQSKTWAAAYYTYLLYIFNVKKFTTSLIVSCSLATIWPHEICLHSTQPRASTLSPNSRIVLPQSLWQSHEKANVW